MKKLLAAVLVIGLAAGAYAQQEGPRKGPGPKGHEMFCPAEGCDEAKKAEFDKRKEAMKAEREEVKKYVEMYNAPGAAKADKAKAEAEVKKIVERQSEQHVKRYEERVKMLENGLSKAKAELKQMKDKKNKEEFINKKTASLLSGEAREMRPQREEGRSPEMRRRTSGPMGDMPRSEKPAKQEQPKKK